MILFFRILGLASIVAATVGLSLASLPTLAALGCAILIGLCVMGFGLCVMAGQITREDLDEANGETQHQLDEANGLKHPDDVEGKN